MRTSIRYTAEGLSVNIKTSDAAALHRLLLEGITAAMRCYIVNESKPVGEMDGFLAMVKLLENLFPGERELSVMYGEKP